MKSSEILKLAIKEGWYGAFTGKFTNYSRIYMCYSLNLMVMKRGISSQDAIRTQNHIKDALGCTADAGYSSLSVMLEKYGMFLDDFRLLYRDSPKRRKLFVGWFEDLIDYLESIGD